MCIRKYFSTLPDFLKSCLIISAVLCVVSTGVSVLVSFLRFYLPRMYCCPESLFYSQEIKFFDYKYTVPLMLAVLAITIILWHGLSRHFWIITLYSLVMFILFVIMTKVTFEQYLWDDHRDLRFIISTRQYYAWEYWRNNQKGYMGFSYWPSLRHEEIYVRHTSPVSMKLAISRKGDVTQW